jgi:hypothetical protein
VFILGPLNALAVAKIKDSIAASTNEGNKVEVYIQAFTEFDPVFDAKNLTPMNFNQYSSDIPTVLVDIINDEKNTDVEFYIFPTQTTKNKYFWSKAAQVSFVAKLAGQAGDVDPKIDELIRTSIVTWLKKDDDVSSGGTYDLKDKTFAQLQEYARDPKSIQSVAEKFSTLLANANPKNDPEVLVAIVPPIFDPFCAVCAAHASERMDAKFSAVPGSKCLVAKPVSVYKSPDLTDQEKTDPVNKGIVQCPFQRPRFALSDTLAPADATTPTPRPKCFVVTWGDAAEENDRKAAAAKDGEAYIEELWASFLNANSTSKGKRYVNRILIVQDYYDYDNKMSVWYILYAFHAEIIELFSVTRPVADKAVMRAMRENGAAFSFLRFSVNPLSPEASAEWDMHPMAPVFTEVNFNAVPVLEPEADRKPLTFELFKTALAMNEGRMRESEEEAVCIASTWGKFIGHMLEKQMVGNPSARWTVENGGHTMRHGLNPAMHTVVEDWYKPGSLLEPAPKRSKTA